MANLIDSYKSNTAEYNGKWYIAKPIPDTRWIKRIKESIGVLTGKYTAIYFYKDIFKSKI